jgi:hypothetical protein
MSELQWKPSVYIAGAMSRLPEFNFKAFDKAKRRLTKLGWAVVSPADIDRLFGIQVKGTTGHETISKERLAKMAALDIAIVNMADAIYMLRDSQDSKGANAELAFARWTGKRIMGEEMPDSHCRP